MAFYKAGTVSVTNGNAKVTGAGTLFNTGAAIGHLFYGPDKGLYEIVDIVSNTELTIDPPYAGSTAGGQAYKIIPTTQYLADAAARMADLITGMAAVRDGIGQGLMAAGTLAAPGLRFANDQDTGIRRPGENQIALTTGGVDRLIANADGSITIPAALTALAVTGAVTVGGSASVAGNFGAGTTTPASKIHAKGNGDIARIESTNSRGSGFGVLGYYDATGRMGFVGYGSPSDPRLFLYNDLSYPITFSINASEVGRFDITGNLLVGVVSADRHVLSKAAARGVAIAQISSSTTGINSAIFASVDQHGYATSEAAIYVGRSSQSGRSANFGGTINASGGDACEVFWKSAACGTILKGEIAGVDEDGKLTRTWSEAIGGFGFKTTNPHLVGRDTYHRKARPEPVAPVYVKPTYDGPDEPKAPPGAPPAVAPLDDRPEQPVQEDGEELIDFIIRMARWVNADAAWVTAMDRRPAEVEAVSIATAESEAAMAQYAIDLPVWQRAWAVHQAAVAAAEAAHAEAEAAFAINHAAWKDRLTAAAKEVDRIATNGQVPVEFDGPFEVGQILVPVAHGGGIGMKAVDVDAATDAEVRRSLGTIIKRLGEDDPDTIETDAIWGRPSVGKPWVFVQGLAPGRPR